MRKVLIGCGVVVAVCVMVVVIAGLVATNWIRHRFPDSKDLERVHLQLEERFGKPEGFVPPLDGVPPADRVARFVAVRDSMASQRDAAAARLAAFIQQARRDRDADRPRITKAVEAVGLVRGGGEVAIAVANYFGRRDRLLLRAEMGEGEYRWLYGLTYYGWLGWTPTADSTTMESVRRLDPEVADEVETARHRIGRLLRTQLENQQRALEVKPQRTAAEEAALAALREELPAAARNDVVPFVGRVPKAWTATLEPYRGHLVATLPKQALEVALDVMRWEPRGRHGIHMR